MVGTSNSPPNAAVTIEIGTRQCRSRAMRRKSTGRGPIISRADFSAIPISLRQRAKIHSETVCTTLLTGRLLTVGSLTSFKSASSYCERVCTGAFAFICTTL
jgi:hypothetical protein